MKNINVSRQMLEKAYDEESDADTRLRILLVLRAKLDNAIPAHVSRELHRTREWASEWLERFDEHGIEGLKTMERSGRPPKLDGRAMATVQRKVLRNESGWTIREVREFIHNEAGVTYSERHVYRLMNRWGLRTIVPEKRLVNKASREERISFKKERQGS